jgi:serine/threonine protein kinase
MSIDFARADFLNWIADELLASLLPNPDLVTEIRHLYETTSPSDYDDPRKWGALAFFLFTVDVRPRSDDTTPLTNYLSPSATRDFLFYTYRVRSQEYAQETLSFHKIGTTSYILRFKLHKRVLKLIKPVYFKITSITGATERYQENYSELGDFSPTVYDSDPRYVIMTFIDGDTLGEYMARYIHSSNDSHVLPPVVLDRVLRIIEPVCAALKICAARPEKVHHLDLSPENILVQHLAGEIAAVCLIDYGYNHLLSNFIGKPDEFSRAQVYMAPELIKGTAAGTELSDAYSLGVIMLELLRSARINVKDLSSDVDEVWLRQPDFARLIEDLMEDDPSRRLLQVERGEEIFSLIAARVRLQLDIYRKKQFPERNSAAVFVETVTGVFFPIASILELRRELREMKQTVRPDPENRIAIAELSRLRSWAYFSHAVHLVCVGCFFVFAIYLYDFRLCDRLGLCVAGPNQPSFLPPFVQGALYGRLNGLLPGRLVALSFAYLMGKYYADILARLTVSGLNLSGVGGLRLTECCVRSIPFWGLFPILYALVVDPKAWPFCSAFGVAGAALNNWMLYRTAEKARSLNRRELRARPSQLIDTELSDFAQWWSEIVIYVVALFSIGVCLFWIKVAKDEFIYAIIVGLVMNILILYAQNCSADARELRVVLARLISSLRRIQFVRGLKPVN